MANNNIPPEDISWYLKQIDKYPPLNYEQERLLLSKAQAGCNKAKERFIKHNLRLVVHIAKKYIRNSLPLPDLIQEGNFGLIHAATKHNINSNCKFSTYAAFWIKHYITRAIDNKGDMIRTPVSTIKEGKKLQAEADRYYMDYHQEPTIPDLVIRTGFNEKKITKLLQINNECSSLDQLTAQGIDFEDVIITQIEFDTREDLIAIENGYLPTVEELRSLAHQLQ